MKYVRRSSVVYISVLVLSLIFMTNCVLASSNESQIDIQTLTPDIPMSECVKIPTTVVTLKPETKAPVYTYETEATITEEHIHVVSYTDDDLDLFARLLTAEAGSTWIPDEVQLYVGSVVLNRMAHDLFPDTLYDVIYQEGQYSPTWNGAIYNTPDERTIANAKKLLEEGSILPANVVFQATFKLGSGVYYEYYDEILNTTTYFCYISN